MIDDDRRIRELLQSYLAENGFRVSVAPTAAAARDKMRGLAFDLLILDVMMPGESGTALAQSLRGDATSASPSSCCRLFRKSRTGSTD